MKTVNTAKKISLSAVLTALALIFSYIELLIPFNFGVPGIKLGLANLVILVALYTVGTSYALSINILRILLSGLLFGNPFAVAYSLAGGVFSFLIMVALKKTDRFSITGVSMAAGAAHNIGQLCMAALVIANAKIFFFLPVLMTAGTVSGILIGMIAHFICRRIGKAYQTL